MRKRWMPTLGAVVLGLLHVGRAEGHTADEAALKQALKQCQGAETDEQCKQALRACEEAQRLLSKLAPGEPGNEKEDGGELRSKWAECENTLGQYLQSEGRIRGLLSLRQRSDGTAQSMVAETLSSLGSMLHQRGEYGKAEALHKRSLDLREKVFGPTHPDVAASLNDLAVSYLAQGQYALAEPLFKRSLGIREKTLSPGHPDVATSLNNLAVLYKTRGQYEQAEPLYKRSLVLREEALGPSHPDVAISLNNLAMLHRVQGQYAQAELLLKRSLNICEKTLGPQHPDVAGPLGNLALIYQAQGRYAQAEPLFKRSLDIREKALGPGHPDVAMSLGSLARLYSDQRQYVQAEPLYKRSLDLSQKALAPGHPDIGAALTSLAGLYLELGQYDKAEPLYRSSLDLFEKAFGPGHSVVAMSLNNLARLHSVQGQYDRAEPLYKRSLDIYEKALGPSHPDVATSLNNLARTYLGQHLLVQALPLLRQAASIREAQLCTTVSETRMQALLDMLRMEEDIIYGLLVGPDLPGAKELALQVALLRKGRVAAAGAAANLMVQRSLGRPEIAQQFKEWQSVRQQQEALLYGGLGKLSPAEYRQRLHDTTLQAEALEAQLASAVPEIRALQTPKMETIISQVAATLPSGSALVEVVWARPNPGRASADGKVGGNPHYAALILFPDQRIVTADLGDAATVDTLGLELRTALASPGTDPVPAAKRLYQQVLQRLQAQLGEVRDLYLSLDGTLNVIPFDALHDGTDYLLGRYRFHYLTSGRDLLRERSPRVPSAPLVLANPEFGQPEAAINRSGEKSLYQRLAGLSRLPGTLREAEAIALLLGIKPLLGATAREEAVRASPAPRILHIATHGLFLQDVDLAPTWQISGSRSFSAMQQERSKVVGMAEAERLPGELSAMNRSALVLADAARGVKAVDAARDGLLTADEARSLDLDGTQLVVLSACETGQGALSAGQGVYGLRRAFLVAGTETLVTSLWRVSDAATGELMTAYYQKLLDKQKPGDRLGVMVEAMQELRRKPGRAHPYYWAPFLVIGRDGPLRMAAR